MRPVGPWAFRSHRAAPVNLATGQLPHEAKCIVLDGVATELAPVRSALPKLRGRRQRSIASPKGGVAEQCESAHDNARDQPRHRVKPAAGSGRTWRASRRKVDDPVCGAWREIAVQEGNEQKRQANAIDEAKGLGGTRRIPCDQDQEHGCHRHDEEADAEAGQEAEREKSTRHRPASEPAPPFASR